MTKEFECYKCKTSKVLNSQNFYRKNNTKTGFATQCKKCKSAYHKEYRIRKIKQNKEYIKNNKNKINEVQCTTCKIIKPLSSKYFYKDEMRKTGFKHICKSCHKIWREENKQQLLDYFNGYYYENRDYYLDYQKEYAINNPALVNIIAQARRARQNKLPSTLTIKDWNYSLTFFDNECAYCGDSNCNLAQEHVIPVLKGGGYTPQNIIPSCQSCNSSKGPKHLNNWFPKRKSYTRERMSKIIDYIEQVTPTK